MGSILTAATSHTSRIHYRCPPCTNWRGIWRGGVENYTIYKEKGNLAVTIQNIIALAYLIPTRPPATLYTRAFNWRLWQGPKRRTNVKVRLHRTQCVALRYRTAPRGTASGASEHLDVFQAPVLVVLVLVLEGADLGVVVAAAVNDVQYLSAGTVLHDVAFHRPLLSRAPVERL